MLKFTQRITIITGHYGSGKTNLAVNLAMKLKKEGKPVTLVDLDIVNPYFRSADFAQEMEQNGIGMITPMYAVSNLDIPALTAQLDGALDTDRYLVIDVGGDDAGAAALGRYSTKISGYSYSMLYVVNRYRYLTQTPADALAVLREIEAASRLSATAVVNNPNLADLTDREDVLSTLPFAQKVAEQAGLPLAATCISSALAEGFLEQELHENQLYAVDIYVKKPWEK